ncbi:MAG: HNH endonuclease [Dehalococcoidia bacterium]|nr:HNH endonuclease [Dehalococcoidia bacterium]
MLRDGEQCRLCRKIPTTRNGLDIDHIDGDKNNYAPTNLRLLCRSCNVMLGNKSRLHKKTSLGPSDRREREREEGNPSTRLVKEAVDYKGGSVEMQASFLFELDYREWVLAQVKRGGALLKKEAIFAGAELVGCSPTTTSKYLAKLTSAAGPLEECRDKLGDTLLIPRNGHKPAGDL